MITFVFFARIINDFEKVSSDLKSRINQSGASTLRSGSSGKNGLFVITLTKRKEVTRNLAHRIIERPYRP